MILTEEHDILVNHFIFFEKLIIMLEINLMLN
jgi:hypothetical protein